MAQVWSVDYLPQDLQQMPAIVPLCQGCFGEALDVCML